MRNAYTGSSASHLKKVPADDYKAWPRSNGRQPVPMISHMGPAMQGQPYTHHHDLQARWPVKLPTSISSLAPVAACAPGTGASSPPAAPAQFTQGRAT